MVFCIINLFLMSFVFSICNKVVLGVYLVMLFIFVVGIIGSGLSLLSMFFYLVILVEFVFILCFIFSSEVYSSWSNVSVVVVLVLWYVFLLALLLSFIYFLFWSIS